MANTNGYPVPDIIIQNYHLGEILNELNCWCMNWKGNINAIYNNELTLVEQVEKLFSVVKTTVESQVNVTDGFTKLYNFVNDFFSNLDLQEEVNNAINEMAKDGRLADLLNKALRVDSVIIPYYMGDIILDYDYVPSCQYRVGNNRYILCFNRNSNTGKVFSIDTSTNTITGNFSATLYHANSCCVKNTYVYVAKTLSADSTSPNGILKYNLSLTDFTVIGEDIGAFMGVSFDNVTNSLYAYMNNGNLYQINEDDSFTLLGTINIPNVQQYNQDICVNNNFMLVSSYKNEFIRVHIPDLKVYGYGTMLNETGDGFYTIDEIEGWEYEGESLYAVCYTKKRESDSFGIFCQLSLSSSRITRPSIALQSGNFTAIINDTSINQFANTEFTFKHPNQLYITKRKFNTLQIDTATVFDEVFLVDDLTLIHNAIFNTLNMRCKNIVFDVDSGYTVKIGTIIASNRGGTMTFGGNNVTYDISAIDFGTSAMQFIIRSGTNFTKNNLFGGTVLNLPTTQTLMLIGSTLPAYGYSYRTEQYTVEANGSYKASITLTLPSSYWPYRVTATTELGKVICACQRTQTGNTLNVDLTLYNIGTTSMTTAVTLALLPELK